MLEQRMVFTRFNILTSPSVYFKKVRAPQISNRFVLLYFINIAHVEEIRNSNINLVLNLKERSQWAELNEDGEIILKLIPKE